MCRVPALGVRVSRVSALGSAECGLASGRVEYLTFVLVCGKASSKAVPTVFGSEADVTAFGARLLEAARPTE